MAAQLTTAAADGGPESVGFSSSSPSTSAISDAVDWVQRLIPAFGSPNYSNYMELCGWGRYLAPLYTFGAAVPGAFVPDLENAGCILFWVTTRPWPDSRTRRAPSLRSRGARS